MNPDEIILEVDFNARTVDDKIRLSPKVEALLGKQVWLTDGDIRVLGTIERTLNGFVALPDWKSLIRLQENHVADEAV